MTDVQLIVNGRVVHTLKVPPAQGQGSWIEIQREIELNASSWIAARAFSLSANGTPDAESHTNPVYVYINERAPYDRDSLDRLVAAIDWCKLCPVPRRGGRRGKMHHENRWSLLRAVG